MSKPDAPAAANNRRCWPWNHDYHIRSGLTFSLFDITAKGILKTCRRCGKVVAK